jgi:hypothetical protein
MPLAWGRFARWLGELDQSITAMLIREKSDEHATLVVSGNPGCLSSRRRAQQP